MRTYLTLSFDQDVERHTLERIKPCIQVAFPALVRGDEAVKGSHRRGVRGRHLWGVCSRPGERFSADFIHEAWSEAIDLEAALMAESDRAYWDRELAAPEHPGQPTINLTAEYTIPGGAVGLIAPGTDMAAMLAETRGAMLRDVREAIPVLEAAKRAVGPLPDPDEEDRTGSESR